MSKVAMKYRCEAKNELATDCSYTFFPVRAPHKPASELKDGETNPPLNQGNEAAWNGTPNGRVEIHNAKHGLFEIGKEYIVEITAA